MTLSDLLYRHIFRGALARQINAEVARRLQAAEPVTDSQRYWTPISSTPTPAQLPWAEHRELLAKCMTFARTQPWAKRYLGMQPDFIIGAGITLSRGTSRWVKEWWFHPLNHMDTRALTLAEEIATAGELFVVLSRNPADGMSYVRTVPAILIDRIETDPDDIEHELSYHQVSDDAEGRTWPAASPDDADHEQVMLHYAVNRAVGSTRGLPDLAPVIRWMERYDLWLEDRVRINRYKGAYLWQVRVENALPAQLEAKRVQYARIPTSGSIIVTDGSERWEAIQPQIAADDVEADGKAIRLMIASGLGLPLHFLSEGESATRATAREMNVPTYKMFAHRQYVIREILTDLAYHAARRAGKPGNLAIEFDSKLQVEPEPEPEPEPDPQAAAPPAAAPTEPAAPAETPPTT